MGMLAYYSHPHIPLPETPEYEFKMGVVAVLLFVVFMAWFLFLVWWFVRQIRER